MKKQIKLPGKIKQLIDGTLSKYKHHMTRNIDTAIENMKDPKNYTDLLQCFELDDLHQEYREKLIKSDVIEQADASALRSWMQGVLVEMKKVHDYFKNLSNESIDENDLEDNSIMNFNALLDSDIYDNFIHNPENIRGIEPQIDQKLPIDNLTVRNYPKTRLTDLRNITENPGTGPAGYSSQIYSII